MSLDLRGIFQAKTEREVEEKKNPDMTAYWKEYYKSAVDDARQELSRYISGLKRAEEKLSNFLMANGADTSAMSDLENTASTVINKLNVRKHKIEDEIKAVRDSRDDIISEEIKKSEAKKVVEHKPLGEKCKELTGYIKAHTAYAAAVIKTDEEIKAEKTDRADTVLPAADAENSILQNPAENSLQEEPVCAGFDNSCAYSQLDLFADEPAPNLKEQNTDKEVVEVSRLSGAELFLSEMTTKLANCKNNPISAMKAVCAEWSADNSKRTALKDFLSEFCHKSDLDNFIKKNFPELRKVPQCNKKMEPEIGR